MSTLAQFRSLDDDALVERVDDLADLERASKADLVRGLVVIAERSTHLKKGYSSIASYGIDRLGFAPCVAYKRGRIVEVALRHSQVVDWLETGATSPTALSLLAGHVDFPDLIAAAWGKTVRQVRRLVRLHNRARSAGVFLDPDPIAAPANPELDPDPDSITVVGSSAGAELDPDPDSIGAGDGSAVLTVPAAVVELIREILALESAVAPNQTEVDVLEKALRTYVNRRAVELSRSMRRPVRAHPWQSCGHLDLVIARNELRWGRHGRASPP